MPYAKIEPSGCGIHKGRIKLRLDFFLNPDEPNYDKYPDTPFHSHFIYPAKDTSDAKIKAEIEKCLNYFYAFHQYCWDKDKEFIEEWKKVPSKAGQVRCPFIKGDTKDPIANEAKVQNILSRIQEFQIDVLGVPPQNLNISKKGTIDVGSAAIEREALDPLYNGEDYITLVDCSNPANASGSLDTVELYTAEADSGNSAKIGTFKDNGSNNLTCHDAEEIGECSLGFNEFTGLSIDINTGEYIGADGRAPYELFLSLDNLGGIGSYWRVGQYCDPEDTGDFTYAAYEVHSLYGTGTESGEPITLELRSATSTDARLILNTSITLELRSSTDSNARLAINVLISLAGRAYAETRAAISLEMWDEYAAILKEDGGILLKEDGGALLLEQQVISLSLRSSTDTRAAITITVTAVTELSLRSSTDTRVALSFDTGIVLTLRSSTDTRASLALEVVPALALRSSTDTRASLALNTLVGLALRSQTDTRVSLALTVATSLTLCSVTDTRASLAFLTQISLELCSTTSTRVAIALTIVLVIELELRSATATRVAIQLNTVIALALLSQTSTRAALSLITAFRHQAITMAMLARSLTLALPDRDLTMAMPARDLTMSMEDRELEMSMPSRTFEMKVRQNG